jgi:hypothetical protein
MSRFRWMAGMAGSAAVLSLAALRVLAADAASVTGTWTASFETQVGTQTYTYTLKVEGSKLTGHSKSNFGESDLTDGKVDKDTVHFVENLDYQGMPLQIVYDGKIVSADEIKFKRDVAGQGGEEFSAKRQK